MSALKVITNHIYPPIPYRGFDWCAYFDGYEESGPYGHGPTETAAIAELMATQGMTPEGLCGHCKRIPENVRRCSVGGCPIGEDA